MTFIIDLDTPTLPENLKEAIPYLDGYPFADFAELKELVTIALYARGKQVRWYRNKGFVRDK